MAEYIGTFYGEPISKMNRKKLLEVIEWMAKENMKLEKRLEKAEDTTIKFMGDCITLKGD